MLRIVRGLPDGYDPSVEVAVLTAVLTRRGQAAAHQPVPPSAWAARDRLLRSPLAPGLDGWRASALPR